MNKCAILNSIKNNYQVKKRFIVYYQVKKLMKKNMNMFLKLGTNLK